MNDDCCSEIRECIHNTIIKAPTLPTLGEASQSIANIGVWGIQLFSSSN